MRIGVLGAGQVGRALAEGLARHGHETRLANRSGDAGGTYADVADWAELVLLAVAGTAAVEVVTSVATELAGKVLVDATNPLDVSSGRAELFVLGDDSLGEQVQRAVPQARVVKAYNTVNNTLMVDPDLPGGPPTMLLAGNDLEAKHGIVQLLESTGWDTADLGGIECSRELEQLCMAWVRIGVMSGTWGHAFKVLRG
ncbi:MAG TPA: NAD(P)-binding domain-containing protein [Mycobacteriales bacterium]|nr:NAD(P)-binding domain-containing protein [Mycobacteriales bacterium]